MELASRQTILPVKADISCRASVPKVQQEATGLVVIVSGLVVIVCGVVGRTVPWLSSKPWSAREGRARPSLTTIQRKMVFWESPAARSTPA
jgi:hypothetical protein